VPTDVHGRILVVDDEPAVCMFVVETLRRAGYDVEFTWRVDDALAQLDAGESFDALVLDVVMPGMRGDEVAREVRTRLPDAKVLFFTGHSNALFDAHPSLLPNEAFLEKPATAAGLRDAVSSLLRTKSSNPSAKQE
jgi:CheY-like chemotaxis protein